MDYRNLLLKYMQHVGDCEGSTFVEQLGFYARSQVEFSDEEVHELKAIERELPEE